MPLVVNDTILDLPGSIKPLQTARHGIEMNILAELGKHNALTHRTGNDEMLFFQTPVFWDDLDTCYSWLTAQLSNSFHTPRYHKRWLSVVIKTDSTPHTLTLWE